MDRPTLSPSESPIQAEIDGLLASGRAYTAAEAEAMVLDAHLADIALLAETLSDESFRRNDLVRLLFAHGSRPWEDSVH